MYWQAPRTADKVQLEDAQVRHRAAECKQGGRVARARRGSNRVQPFCGRWGPGGSVVPRGPTLAW
eukprot:7331657-Lingulodinium_polyedra.AAC.1